MTRGFDAGPAPLYVALIWHMHQPYYKDMVTGDYSLPWVRLHALKDYYHMGEIIAQHPGMHITFNFVPSLVQQITEYAEGTAIDRCLATSLKQSWTHEEKSFMLSFFFSIDWEHFIRRYPRYWQLLELRRLADSQADIFDDAYYRDLAAWFNLIWIDRGLLESDKVLRRMVDKGRDYTHEDILVILGKQREIIGRILPLYRSLEKAGQIEISTTPFYHPILPLLADTNSTMESMPDSALPTARFSHPEDADEQLRRAAIAHERAFGRRPRGLWPSEGSVCQAIVPLLSKVEGLRWIATDEGILSRSLGLPIRRDGHANVTNPDVLYQPYRLQLGTNGSQEPAGISIIFRDVVLSDRIGFVYKSMSSQDAVSDLLSRLHTIRQRLGNGGTPRLVSIILDGENCWEEYEDNGTPFLNALYHRLSSDPGLMPVTVSEYLHQFPARQTIRHLFAGSWINHNLRTWIGERAQNRAWEYLLRTRQWLIKWQRESPLADWDTLEKAWEEIYIAEGSDWFWWYYSCNNPSGENHFDQVFRQHLRNVYRIVGVPSPTWLDSPILVDATDERERPPTTFISPGLSAKDTASEDWQGAGFVETESSTGTMQRSQTGIRRLYYGYDQSNLYLRIESDEEISALQISIYLSVPNGSNANQHPRHVRADAGAALPGSNGLHKEILLNGPAESATLNLAAGQEIWEHQTMLAAKIGPYAAEIRASFSELDLKLGDMISIGLVATRDDIVSQVLPTSGETMLALSQSL